MSDPHELPRPPEELAEVNVNAASTPPHFTHITVNGCNLLGLINVFAFMGLMCLTAMLPDNRVLRIGFAVLVVCGSCAADLVSRLSTGNGGGVLPLLSPHAGGALLFTPVWAVYPGLIIAAVVAVIVKR
jgi:hypothetical protein